MGYGAPLKNQNKGYDAQEKKDLMKMPGDFKQMSKGSWMSKHISSPLAMGMQPEMNGPLDVTKAGQKKILASDANQAFKAAIAKESPTEMHGALHMDKGAPAMNKGSMAYNQGEKDKDDESIAGRLGKRGLNISSKDRRDESLGKYGTRT